MSRTIMKRVEAERVALEYQPRKFPFAMDPVASDFVQSQKAKGSASSFRMNSLIAEQTGVADLERASVQDQIEIRTLEKVKEIQEKAFEQAYKLGLDEGRAEAFAKHDAATNEHLTRLNDVIHAMTRLKVEMVNSNETHIVKMIYHLASRIALYEIAQNPEAIVPVLKSVIEGSESQEQITVRISPQDFAFLNQAGERLGKELESLKRARLDESPEIQSGGCVVETNYSLIDATLEERVQKLMDVLLSSTPKVRDTMTS